MESSAFLLILFTLSIPSTWDVVYDQFRDSLHRM